MLQAQEAFIEQHASKLREKINIGLEQIRKGQVVDGRTAIRNLREKLRRRESGNG
jgi:hypothetical protein